MHIQVYFLDNEEFNDELSMNRCSAIYIDAKDDSGLLNTKIFLEIKDCKGRLLLKSANGSSRLKKYVKAYRESIKGAFNSLDFAYAITLSPLLPYSTN